jgi:sulfite exporter TauE/SafE
MQTSLALTGLFMGLAGGPHCIAMCGAACAGIGRSATGSNTRGMWSFQLGRLLGYTTLGAVVATSMQGLGWLSVHSAVLRPLWTLFHVAAAVLGGVLLWQARQPVWLEGAARSAWQRARRLVSGGATVAPGAAQFWPPLMAGMIWTFLPCGLLYSALLVAALSQNWWEGAVVMALFALGSSVSLMAGPWLWLRMQHQRSGRWAVRLAGLALLASSAWALWMGLVHNTAPWCVTG